MAQDRTFSRRSALIALGTVSVSAVALPAFAGPTDPQADKTLFLAGDSTAAQIHQDSIPFAGWGMGLPYYVTPRLAVSNQAMSGRSSKSFIDEGRLASILAVIKAGDILVVQFGHNDQKAEDPKRYTEPWTTYKDHLRQYVDGARSKGAIPVLVTSAERRRFDRAGNAYSSHGDYPAAMRSLAGEMGVPLIDVQAQSLALWQQLGPEETKDYFVYTDSGIRDNTHFQPRGAAAIAQMVAQGLAALNVLEDGYTRRLDEVTPVSWFSWPDGTTPPPAPL